MNPLYRIDYHLRLKRFPGKFLPYIHHLLYRIIRHYTDSRFPCFLNFLFQAILSVLHHIHSLLGRMCNPYIPAGILLSLYTGHFLSIVSILNHTIHPVHYNSLINNYMHKFPDIHRCNNMYLPHNMIHSLHCFHTALRMFPYHMRLLLPLLIRYIHHLLHHMYL